MPTGDRSSPLHKLIRPRKMSEGWPWRVAGSPILGLAGSPRIVVASLQNGEAVGNRIGGQETTWTYYGDGTPLATAPVVNNGNIFVTGLDGDLYVFGTPGRQAY